MRHSHHHPLLVLALVSVSHTLTESHTPHSSHLYFSHRSRLCADFYCTMGCKTSCWCATAGGVILFRVSCQAEDFFNLILEPEFTALCWALVYSDKLNISSHQISRVPDGEGWMYCCYWCPKLQIQRLCWLFTLLSMRGCRWSAEG